MTFYMLRSKRTGLFFRSANGRLRSTWVEQKGASVWSKIEGVQASARSLMNEHMARFVASADDLEIVTINVDHPKVTIADGDDWEGLYLDGVLVHQDHEIRVEDLLHFLNIECKRIFVDRKWLDTLNCLPDKVEDVKLETKP